MKPKESVAALKRKIATIKRKGKNDGERIEMLFDHMLGTSLAKSSTKGNNSVGSLLAKHRA